MVKISRNNPCPCESGRKYKHCCLLTGQVFENKSQTAQINNSLVNQIKKIQDIARDKKQVIRDHGIFVFFSNDDGDAWMLEVAELDGLQVAKAGEPSPIELEEDSEVITINYSHAWIIRNKKLFLTSYTDNKESELVNAPTQQLNAAMRRILKRYTAELLAEIHSLRGGR